MICIYLAMYLLKKIMWFGRVSCWMDFSNCSSVFLFNLFLHTCISENWQVNLEAWSDLWSEASYMIEHNFLKLIYEDLGKHIVDNNDDIVLIWEDKMILWVLMSFYPEGNHCKLPCGRKLREHKIFFSVRD